MRTQDTYIEADSCTSALTATASTGRRPRISEHEMAGPGPSSQEARSSDSSRPAFEPCLFEPESLFPGNRILCGETKATKHPRKVLEDASRDEAHAKQLGQWGGKCGMAGKSLWRSECVVADAVAVEPVSARNFPANREKNRVTRDIDRRR
jgi:hypothetical protein